MELQFSVGLLIVFLIFLILCSAFFSSSETGIMALNHYRIKHQANEGKKNAKRVLFLIKRTDRLLSVILIGNCFVNSLAASIATIIGLRYLNDLGPIIASVILTFVLLIFGEVTPKMFASMHPNRVALLSSSLLYLLTKIFNPLSILISGISKTILNAFGIKKPKNAHGDLNKHELRTLVNESGDLLPKKHQGMLLGVLDLDSVEVDEIMTPRNEIVGINIEDDIASILNKITTLEHTRFPVYRQDINNVIGELHMRSFAKMISQNAVTKEKIQQNLMPIYYVPEGTPLNTQLYNFQTEKRRLALVVDEYGDIQGLVTLEDILEEIVGKFTTDAENDETGINKQSDGSYLVHGTIGIREINKSLKWSLPTDKPKTINGLIFEILEEIPEGPACLIFDNKYCIEIIGLAENKVKVAKLFIKEQPEE